MLTYMATCRSTDKKPCDNIPKESTISKLADNVLENNLGGDRINTAFSKTTQIASTVAHSTDFTRGLTESFGFTNNAALSAVTVAEPLIGLGKVLYPSVR